jgi:hypothetical protein
MKRPVGVLLLALSVLVAGCGANIDLEKSLAIVEPFSGWYDAGIKDGLNKLVPSISFKLQNTGAQPITQVQLIVSFWQQGADGESDSKEVEGIGGEAVAPAASSRPILVRSEVGYTLEQARAELFTHRQFKDFLVKVFAKRGGKIVKLGEFTIDRRIIPNTTADARP